MQNNHTCRIPAKGRLGVMLLSIGLSLLPMARLQAADVAENNAVQMVQSSESTLRNVRGRVFDAKGAPIVGATIYNAAAATGTTSDADGAFVVRAATGQMLAVSFVGYDTQEVKVPASGTLTVELSENAQMLSDVVVVGYATQKKINVTGAVSSISGDELAQRPVVSTMQALQGVDPSLNISIESGNPIAGNSLNIRGVPSINGGSPLILVDGVPGVSLRLVNPTDIESISVLKDASASAIYGAKASAGVILVTTKKGSQGKAVVKYSNNIGWTQPTTPTDFITNGYDYAKIVDNLYFSRYAYSAFNYTEADWAALEARRYDKTEHPDRPWVVVGDDGKYHYYGNFDWYHSIYNTNRFHQEHNLSLSGGGQSMNYYVSGRYYEQDGVLSGSMIQQKEKYKNYAFRAKFDAQIFKWAKWSTNASLNAVNQKYPGTLNEAQTIAALEENVAPMFVPYNPDGSIVMYPADLRNVSLGKGRTASLADPANKHTIENLSLTLSNSLNIKFYEDLTFDANYNINNYRRLYKDRTVANTYSDAIGVSKSTTHYQKDTYRERPYEYTYHNVDAYLTYAHTWNNAHNFKAVAGMNYERYRMTDNIVEQFGVGSEQLDSFNSVNDDTYWIVTQDISAYKTLGFFGRINYDYNGKYLFEASLRADGTSRFAKKDRWGIFPSVSAGWRFTEEPFMEPLSSWWDNGKIRLSYGELGNQQVADYLYLQTIGTGTLNYLFDESGKANYASVSDPMSSSLTWETVRTYNLGLDLSFLNNRLSFTGDLFIRDTKDMLTQSLTLPSVYGAATPTENCADLRTKGWEFSLTWRDRFQLAGKPFHYSITGQVGDYQTEITKYNNPTKLFNSYYEGKMLGEIWGYHVPKLFDTDEEAAAYQKAINNSSNVYQRVYNMQNNLGKLMAGDVMFEDRDNSGSIGTGAGTVDDPGDMIIIGNSTPRYNYSFRIEASWNGFDISAFFQGVGKRDWYPAANKDDIYGSNQFWQLYGYTIPSFITYDFMDDIWTEEHPDRYFPRLRPIQSYNGGPLGQNNDRYLQSVAYLRFKNLTIGYTIPALKRYISKLRIYVSGENLCYWSPLKKYCKLIDPELAVSDGLYKAGSGTGYIMPKTFSFGIDITF